MVRIHLVEILTRHGSELRDRLIYSSCNRSSAEAYLNGVTVPHQQEGVAFRVAGMNCDEPRSDANLHDPVYYNAKMERCATLQEAFALEQGTPLTLAERRSAVVRAIIESDYDFYPYLVEASNGASFYADGDEMRAEVFLSNPDGGDSIKAGLSVSFRPGTAHASSVDCLHGDVFIGEPPCRAVLARLAQ